ncbi:MAG: prolyl oligopeptidase family serine peptidase [Bradyrhizobium sp.]|uniref:alpha/beta hydrolase family protein n=1 Tax=Bradyrhizobium sp. TaxID=376 RepID=UPI001C28588C|nr:prolyl oligopeptidase family serine peptidase [Bradyrhizobium sp.]MBU6464394.1 prolyl oligopeptidase family serine peptidase [Pseudomonadota bacterium]MDE2069442.1 prolyl oligopeptidase family serine peptidase [Bradyrhizobium sp.]
MPEETKNAVVAATLKHHFSCWQIRVLSLFLLVCGCGAAFDGGASAQTWTTSNQLAHGTYGSPSALVQWQVGYYYSTIDGSQIYGMLCIPPTSRPGPYPIAILNHGTNTNVPPPYAGIEPTGLNGCLLMAEAGWLTAISTYRGEYIAANIGANVSPGSTNPSYLSGGQFELCNHEVDDVLDLLSAVTSMPNANGNQVFMWGHSHGACITERAIEKGAKVNVAVSIDGPTDLTTWVTQPPLSGPPLNLTLSDEQMRSSALNSPAAIGNVKFLRIQAEGDHIVTPDQACELASKLSGSVNYYLYDYLSAGVGTPPGVYENASPPECTNFSLSWVNQWVHNKNSPPSWVLPDEAYGHNQPYPAPGPWPQTVLLVYGKVKQLPPGQIYHTWILEKAWPEYSSFVNAVATFGGWSASIPPAFVSFE